MAMSRSLNGGVTSLAGICAVVVALAAIDSRVRDQVSAILSGRAPSGELVTITQGFESFAYTVLQAVRDQSIEHAALTIFALGAMVLLLFMMRT
jgi:hypothetical protein